MLCSFENLGEGNIIENHQDFEGLLCSNFFKILMYWVSKETDLYVWRPNNIIACFKSCLRRLQYCVRYSILMHYFICENNLFHFRFNANTKTKMTSVLKNLYEEEINCFASSETLQDNQNWFYESNKSLISENTRLFQQIMPIFSIFQCLKVCYIIFYITLKPVYQKVCLLYN